MGLATIVRPLLGLIDAFTARLRTPSVTVPMPADAPEALRRILSKEENIGWILPTVV